MTNVLCHPDDIRSCPKSSGWHNVSWITCLPYELVPVVSHPDDLWTIQAVFRMTYDVGLCHPVEITILIPMSSGWLRYRQYLIWMTYGRCILSSGWLTWRWYVIRMGYGKCIMSSGWHTLPSFCLPDDLTEVWNLIRMSYGNVIMSSRWDTLPFSSHPDEMVALQRFRNYLPIRGVNSCK